MLGPLAVAALPRARCVRRPPQLRVSLGAGAGVGGWLAPLRQPSAAAKDSPRSRRARPTDELDSSGVVVDAVWDAFAVRLLSKRAAPKQLRFLRPIAMCLASAELRRNACFHKLSAYDDRRNEAHLEFALGCSCIELATTIRLVLGHAYHISIFS